jgi:hypothetical protein
VGLFPKRPNLNWNGITLQQAKIKLEWYYSPRGKTLNWSGNIPKRLKLNWSGIIPHKTKFKLEWDYSSTDKN